MARKRNPAERDIPSVVRELCLAFPEAEEVSSHGAPNFRVRGRSFASLAINHHGDGFLALWLVGPPGAQEFYVGNEPEQYFIPPYVGPRGWLGVQLDRGLSWPAIAGHVRAAYEQVAPAVLTAALGDTPVVAPPAMTIAPEDFDPLALPRHAKTVAGLRQRALALPEVVEGRAFGDPVWRAGRKTFATAYAADRGVCFGFWVGVAQQSMLSMDDRFHIPAYSGHNGWIALDVTEGCRWQDVDPLLLNSYRHFALKRMLKALDAT